MYVARSSIVAMTAGLALAAGLSACGRVDEADKPSAARPPQTLHLSAAVTTRGVLLSPARIGGGPLRIIVSNQTARPVRPTLSGGSDAARATTLRTIAPGGIAALSADVTPGTWRLRAAGAGRAAELVVGTRRASADGTLSLP
jgi:hypothetical protein